MGLIKSSSYSAMRIVIEDVECEDTDVMLQLSSDLRGFSGRLLLAKRFFLQQPVVVRKEVVDANTACQVL